MKHIIMAALLGLAIIVSQIAMSPQVHARDVYVGTSNTTGRDCYVMTETINSYIKGRRGITTDVRLKMVRRSDNNIKYLDYQFYEDGNNYPYFRNSQGYEGFINEYETPIEWRMYQVIMDNSR
ncbi:MAG: hypothetical protein IJ563_06700 [Selenomonadaceae bacterium]|nr:hypothetical protein [Selenomonadaceae bacterium]MBR1860027.1 hypothetical protein [Selenomonadaceae bacterium]